MGNYFKDHMLLYNKNVPPDRVILQHEGNHCYDLAGCCAIGGTKLQLNGVLYGKSDPIELAHGQFERDVVVSNSKLTVAQAKAFVEKKGYKNVHLYMHEPLIDEERQHVIDTLPL